MIVRLFRATLEKVGVKPMEAVGQPFDPSLHQAVAQVESPADGRTSWWRRSRRGTCWRGGCSAPAMVKVSQRRRDRRRSPASPLRGGAREPEAGLLRDPGRLARCQPRGDQEGLPRSSPTLTTRTRIPATRRRKSDSRRSARPTRF